MKKLAILLSILIVSACATVPTPNSEQRLVPSGQVFLKSLPPSQDTAQIVVIRDQGFFGSANFLHFYIDGQKVASLDPRERLELYLAAGEHIFGVKPTDPLGVHAGFNIDQTLQSGRTYYYRLLIDSNAGARIQRELAETKH